MRASPASAGLTLALLLAAPAARAQIYPTAAPAPAAPAPWAAASPALPPPPGAPAAPAIFPASAPAIFPASAPARITPQDRTERVFVEAGAGLAAGLTLGVAGLYIGSILGLFSSSATRSGDPLGNFFRGGAYGGIIAVSIGLPLGIYLAGDNYHGNGGIGWTYLGSIGGSALAFGLAYAANEGSVPVWMPIVAGIALPMTGGLLGYELSSDPDARLRRARRMRVVPVAAASAGGGVLGVAGTF